MKRILLYFVLLGFLFSGCKKEATGVFSESADTRLNATLAEYQKALTGAPNGWKAIITPGNKIPYQFYFKFSDSNRVIMYADLDPTTATESRESSYRLKALQQPSLIFDTYSYIHLLADPDGNVNGGNDGAGLSSDFEFAFLKVVGDTIKLMGRINKTMVDLVKATKQEADDWANQNLYNALSSLDVMSNFTYYYKQITVNGIQYEIHLDPIHRKVTIIWKDAGGVSHSFISGFSYTGTPSGITFLTPFTSGSTIIRGIYNLVFNTGTGAVDVSLGNNVNTSIVGVPQPISVDVDAPSRFWNQSRTGSYWASVTGFTVNGVVDAYGLTTIPGFWFLYYKANNGIVNGNIPYDYLGFIVNGGFAAYGQAFRLATLSSNGRIIFPYLGAFAATPPAYATIVTNTRTTMADPNGFYLFQTSDKSYDMISVRDTRIWLTWEQ